MRRKGSLVLILLLLLGVCSVAGAVGEKGNACSHDWQLISSDAPTCTRKGKDIYRCSKCGKKKTEHPAALGHAWDICVMERVPTCTETGLVRCTCSRDKSHVKENIQPALGHSWGEWKTVRAAQLTKAGQKERICSRCSRKEQKILPALIQRNEYDLRLLVFPETEPASGIPAGRIREAGEAGVPLSWFCALANTGKKDLWIHEEASAVERVFLAAGDVLLLPVRRILTEKELPEAPSEALEFLFRFIGETEDGTPVCASETVAEAVRILADGLPEQKASIEIRQEREESGSCAVNDILRYTVFLRHTGSAAFRRVEIRGLPGEESLLLENWQPGEEKSFSVAYTVSQRDAVAGFLCWAAEARITGLEGDEPVSVRSNPLILQVRAE